LALLAMTASPSLAGSLARLFAGMNPSHHGL
jgi:hypothetical protein